MSNIEALYGVQKTRCALYVLVRDPSNLYLILQKLVVITRPKLLFTVTVAFLTLGS